jgi:hypothetical protein
MTTNNVTTTTTNATTIFENTTSMDNATKTQRLIL